MIVLDANILIRAVLGRRVRQILEMYEAAEVLKSLEYLQQIIEPIDDEVYGDFETEARERLRGRDENDWPILATALALDCGIWSEDRDFFGTGVAVWTTNRIEILLKSHASKSA